MLKTRLKTALGKRFRLFLTACVALSMMSALDEETLECEQAIAYAKGCCDTLSVRSICGDGCSSTTLTLSESECIQDLACEQIREQNICQRLTEASDLAEQEEFLHHQVCP